MAYDKQTFLQNVVVLIDTREQKNEHIAAQLDSLGIRHESRKLDFGDYSFQAQGRDFSLSCVIERKANVNELYGNFTSDRDRIEKEFKAGSSLAREFILLLEDCSSMEALKQYVVPAWEMEARGRKVANIGELCYSTLRSWQCGDRYHFRTVFVPDRKDTAVRILEEFYWYWRNYKKLTVSRRNRGGDGAGEWVY